MKLNNFVCVLILSFLSSCTHNIPSDGLSKAERKLFDQFNSAYLSSDTIMLEGIFDEWADNVTTNEVGPSNHNTSLNEIYNVYRAFYKPDNPHYLGELESFHLADKDLKYLLVQNRLYYAILNNNDFEISNYNQLDTIYDFRPSLEHLGNDRILYLVDDYRIALHVFLGSKYLEIENKNISAPLVSSDEGQKRSKFLKKYIHIVHSHWGGYWHIDTHPQIEILLMNNELNKSKIYFRYGYQFGTAYLEKLDNQWIIVSSEATGIE